MTNGLQIDEEQFKKMDEKEQNLVLYRNLNRMETKLKRKTKIDNTISAAAGFLGGLFAVAGKWFFLKG